MSEADHSPGWPRESCRAALERAAADLGRAPTTREFAQYPGPSVQAVRRAFGSWQAGVEAAGLEVGDGRE